MAVPAQDLLSSAKAVRLCRDGRPVTNNGGLRRRTDLCLGCFRHHMFTDRPPSAAVPTVAPTPPDSPMTAANRSSQADVSLRLDQVLRVYAHDLNRETLSDLRDAIAADRHRWFRAEFERAVADKAYTAEAWCAAIGTNPHTPVAEQQRIIWTVVFPGEPFPA